MRAVLAVRGPAVGDRAPGKSRAPGEPPKNGGRPAQAHRTNSLSTPPRTRGSPQTPAPQTGAVGSGGPRPPRPAAGGDGRAGGHGFAASSHNCPSAGRAHHAIAHSLNVTPHSSRSHLPSAHAGPLTA